MSKIGSKEKQIKLNKKKGERRKGKERQLEDNEIDQIDDIDHENKDYLLNLLNSRCGDMLGYQFEIASANGKDEVIEVDDVDDEHEVEEEGFEDMDYENMDDNEDGSQMSEEDDEFGSSSRCKVFMDPSASIGRREEVANDTRKELRNFMSSSVKKQMARTSEKEYKGNKKKRSLEEEEEAKMQELDKTLSQIISDIPHTEKKGPAVIEKNTPLPLRRAKEAYRLMHARREDEARRESSTIGARTSSIALTKRQFRAERGLEETRRRKAGGLGGVFGKIQGGSLRLSARDRKNIAGGGRKHER